MPSTYEYPALPLLYTPGDGAFMNLVERAFRDSTRASFETLPEAALTPGTTAPATGPCIPLCIPPGRNGLDAPVRRRIENIGKSHGLSPRVTLGVSLTR